MTTKSGIWIIIRKAQVSAKLHCPTSTVTLFSEDGEGRIHSSTVIKSQKRPANSGGTAVYSYPCYGRCRGWMPRGFLLFLAFPVFFIMYCYKLCIQRKMVVTPIFYFMLCQSSLILSTVISFVYKDKWWFDVIMSAIFCRENTWKRILLFPLQINS